MCLTADNATSNNTLTEQLAIQNPAFEATGRIRCFLHICNLVAKSLLQLFDGKKAAQDEVGEDDVAVVAGDIDFEEDELRKDQACDGENQEEDNTEGLIDELDKLDNNEQNNLINKLQPIKKVLVKVRIASSTKAPL